MDSSKKIILFYASAGHGHEKAARATQEAVQALYPQAQTKLVDVIALMPPFFGEVYRQTYLLQIKYVPWLWGIFYYSFDMPWIYFFVRHIRRAMNAMNSGVLKKLILTEKPDVIFTTHFFATEVVSHLKKKGLTQARLVTVVTDYIAHNVWVGSGVDAYAVGLEETKQDLLRRGVLADKIHVTGIPVEKKFFAPVLKEAVLKNLSLEPSIFTVLVTSGGIGMGSVEPLIQRLFSSKISLQVILVCGSNRAFFERAQGFQKSCPGLRVLGFVNNMNELMEIADVVVGKAGGLTITESFLKNKPLILLGSIPGQEARNVVCVKAHGAGLEARSVDEAAQIILNLSQSPDRVEALKCGAMSMASPEAAPAIARLAR